jgi:hypothetical protein
MIRAALSRPLTGVTPESTSATPMPVPVIGRPRLSFLPHASAVPITSLTALIGVWVVSAFQCLPASRTDPSAVS